MIRGLYTSANGMMAQLNRMDVVSNNIANVDTTAYKKDFTVTRSFSEELAKKLDDQAETVHSKSIGKMTPGVFVDDIFTDMRNGSLKETYAPLDAAIIGDGFFTVNVKALDGKESTKYTRDGSFAITAQNTLVTKDGNVVQGENGAIVLPNGNINIDEAGNVKVNGELIDKLKMTSFKDTHTLRKTGDNYYDTTEASEEQPFAGKLQSGFLENSNVNSVKEMVDMITVNRAYEANQKMVTIHDTILAKAVNDIGRK